MRQQSIDLLPSIVAISDTFSVQILSSSKSSLEVTGGTMLSVLEMLGWRSGIEDGTRIRVILFGFIILLYEVVEE
eukprot:10661259-Ditylum_brightwellii.AAC.1